MLTIIEGFEKTVQNEGRASSDTVLEFIIKFAAKSQKVGGLLEQGIPQHICEMWYTRVASLLTQWLIDENTILTIPQFEKLCMSRNTIINIFYASGYRGMRHLVPLMCRNNAGQLIITSERLPVLLGVLSLDDISDDLMSISLQKLATQSDMLFFLMITWLSQRLVITEQGERNRTRLLASGYLVENVAIAEKHIPNMMFSYMYSSYASNHNKHDIKATFNKLFSNLLLRGNIKPKSVHHHPNKKRPKMVIIHEQFRQTHAMFRCYAPYIRSLSDFFDLIAVADENNIDKASDELFNKVIVLEASKAINERAKIIQDLHPDIIYYPSVGMDSKIVILSNLRLAPVQIASQGHPATTRSKEIDYIFVPEMEGDVSQIYSEKVLMGVSDVQMESHKNLPIVLPKRTRKPDGIVHIAVNAKVMKLSYRLIDICKRLQKEAKEPVKFHFFPGEQRISYDGIVSALKNQLPEAEVYGVKAYPEFLQALKNCDLSLAPFPFGNTNSTVDCCLLGIPVVAYFGSEISAQSDKMVLQQAKAPLWLVSDTEEGYFQTALKLINDEAFRKQTIAQFDPDIMRQNIFSATNGKAADFGRMIEYAYRHHQELIASSDRVFRYNDIFSEIKQCD